MSLSNNKSNGFKEPFIIYYFIIYEELILVACWLAKEPI